MSRARWLAALMLAAALAWALAYLRDPPWLLHMTSGMRGSETARDGARVRWMGGHASFFVPSQAHAVILPLRTTFDDDGDWPVTVTISLDDRTVDRVVLADASWQRRIIPLPAPGGRRTRRIDIRVDRTRSDNRGAAIGAIAIE